MDIRVTSVIQTDHRRLNSKRYVPSTTLGRATLGANGVANKLFIAFLFSDPYLGVHSAPATSKVYDITHCIVTKPVRRQMRRSHQSQGEILQSNCYCSSIPAGRVADRR